MLKRTELRCPRCEYDVAQTIRDGRAVCPECGSPVSEDLCTRLDRLLPGRYRLALVLTWLPSIPLTACVFAAGETPLAFIPAAIGIAPVYLAMWRAERWLHVTGACTRAAGMTVGVVILNLAIATVIGGVLAIVARSL